MISILKQIIRENPNWLRRSGSDLSFMKMSTSEPEHGTGESKILLFGFEAGEKQPTVCVKTVRTYSAREVIKRNHDNLQLLVDGVRGSEHIGMFARPLYLYDQNNLVFSVESVCDGIRLSQAKKNINMVIDKYIAWQAHLAASPEKLLSFDDLADLANDAIKSLGLSENSALVLQTYYRELALDSNISLPVLIQHGDLTLDNILISGEQIYLIDYDHVGVSKLPGFDLFNLFFKFADRLGESLSVNCERYLPQYFRSIGARIAPGAYASILFIHYLQERQRKMHLRAYGEKSGEEIVSNFRSLVNK